MLSLTLLLNRSRIRRFFQPEKIHRATPGRVIKNKMEKDSQKKKKKKSVKRILVMVFEELSVSHLEESRKKSKKENLHLRDKSRLYLKSKKVSSLSVT